MVTTSTPSERGARAALRLLTREIRARQAAIGRGFYDIGVRLRRIQSEELWRAGGFETFEDYVERGAEIRLRSGYRFMRIAEHFNAAIAERYGARKLDAALRYLQATPEKERPGDLLAAEIRVRDASGRFRSQSLHESSARDIEEAARLEHELHSARMQAPRDIRRRVQQLGDALPPPPRGIRRGERVRAQRAADGRIALSFRAIPLDELDAFLRSVREHLGDFQGRGRS